jgi:hypothetical protein
LNISSKTYCQTLVAAVCMALTVNPLHAGVVQDLTADQIVERAVARADRQRRAQADLNFTATISEANERLDGDGNVEETELFTYRQYPFEGVLFEELVAQDGVPLDADDLRDVAQGKEEFAEQVRERLEDGEDPRPPDQNRVDFDEEFAARYDYSIIGEDVVNGHLCWAIYLSPRDGDLPVRRAIDNALNNSTGHLWISMDDYGLVRVEFEMARSVRFWFGLLGTLRNTTGHLEFERVTDGVWLPTIVDIRADTRGVLFRNARRRIVRIWDDYVRLPTAE